MSDIAIKVEDLSKQYRLGLVGTGTLSHDLNRWWHQLRGLPDPYLKVGESNDRSKKGESDYVWALRDINFEIKQGEVVGIIGKNGAGKSTLLKVLSRVTSPTTGFVKAKGRIASLLEVGTGFHPELTGRENIYLNGTILGMRKAEVARKLEEIVEFSGVARYIDTPVKRYSSGMTVRLGFAVAAHLEPEILIVDEVLAVGDAEFQKKAIGKMQEVSQGGGRTVLFVSHNMASIQALCTKGIVMYNGSISFVGNIEKSVTHYLSLNKQIYFSKHISERVDRVNAKEFKFVSINIHDENGKDLNALSSGDYYKFKIGYVLKDNKYLVGFRMLLVDEKGVIRILCNSVLVGATPQLFIATQSGEFAFIIEKFPLPKGNYSVQLTCYSQDGIEDDIENALHFSVEGGDFYGFGREAVVKEGVLVEYRCSL